jgi:hypothetical protein
MSTNDTLKNSKASTQARAIIGLLKAGTIKQAAKYADISSSTLYRFLKDADFQDELRQAEGIVLDRAARKLIKLSCEAVEALADIMRNPEQKAAAQKRYAASEILSNVLKLWDVRNIERRLIILENEVLKNGL